MTACEEYQQPKFATKRKEGGTEVIFVVDDREVRYTAFGSLEVGPCEYVKVGEEPSEERVRDILMGYYQGKASSRYSAVRDVKREIRDFLDIDY